MVILLLIFIFALLVYSLMNTTDNLLYIKSKNGIYMIIKDKIDEKSKISLMTKVINNMYLLKNHLVNHNDIFEEYKDYIKLLETNFHEQRTYIHETKDDTNLTSYSMNKGEEVSLCLKSKITGELHDLNLLMYVAIHEMAHIACPEIGHGPLFQKIFKKLLEESMNIGIYRYDDYNRHHLEYCGIEINSTVI